MKTLKELQKQYYEEFRGLPSIKPIVRNGQENDAFELVVLNVLYKKHLPVFIKENVLEFSKYVIAPPDSGIDIFFQHDNGDDSYFDVIQVKSAELTEAEIKDCITKMERTIEDFCKDPKKIPSESCREILSDSNLDKSNKKQCTYYVVHTGTVDDFLGSRDNEKVLTIKALEVIHKNITDYVDNDSLEVGSYVEYGYPYDSNGALVCSINGFDLAQLCNTYYNTERGRNILFGSNLRESLITIKSKPFRSMENTILNCPENFWYYNNGITIIAKNIKKNESIVSLEGFSIVNGAQTTSALGLFLKEAKKCGEDEKKERIEKLKKVNVLSRILKVPDEKMRQDIAIFNNTQNPITSRDMVANRPEQRHLNEWLLSDDEYPQIYVEIRRGSQLPANFNKLIVHRKTTNEELAQLIYASFLQRPFTAKDRKSALFNNDYTQDEYVINKIYHDVFYWNEEEPSKNGVVFTKTKKEIDELLFVQELYKEAKKVYKSTLTERRAKQQEKRDQAKTPEEIKSCEDRIASTSLMIDTIGICMFYFVALYYEFKAQFSDGADGTYNYDRFYSDKSYRAELVKNVVNLYLANTVDILVKTAQENGKSGNVNNWVRSSACEPAFFIALRNNIDINMKLQDDYDDFVNKYKKAN